MMFAFMPMAKADEDDFTCLVEAIYHEARSEPLMGMIAVANTILNRVYSKRYPNTICSVVHQGKYWEGHPVKNKCQFSYWCDGKPEMFNDMASLKKSIGVAEMSLMGVVMRDTLNSTHYHATYVKGK
jgi:N-acetylmuramoyl-L-alanine amidase